MALVIDKTLSGFNANSYCDTAFADDYFAGHVNSVKRDAWAVLTDDQKTQALINATYVIEELKFTIATEPWDATLQYDNVLHRNYYTSPAVPGSYVKYTALQALQFPRNIDIAADSSGTYIPPAVLNAQCEQAIYLATVDDAALIQQMQGVTAESFLGGGIQVSTHYAKDGGRTTSMLHPLAKQLLNPYILRNSGMRFRRA